MKNFTRIFVGITGMLTIGSMSLYAEHRNGFFDHLKVTTMITPETLNIPKSPTYGEEPHQLPEYLRATREDNVINTTKSESTPFFSSIANRNDLRRVSENGKKTQQLDSLVRISLGGEKYIKQSFAYTEDGKPSKAVNFLMNDVTGDWEEKGYSLIEYDGLGRITVKEQYDETYQMETFRYEYVYSGDSDLYSIETYFEFNGNEWVPVQRGEYAYDTAGNCTLQMLYGMDRETGAWTEGMKITVEYDAWNHVTGYYEYTYDEDTKSWVGYDEGKTYNYQPDGRLLDMYSYIWENNEWFKFEHRVLTYDEAGRNTVDEYLYWNRQKQDWTGGDEYGEYGYVENNRKIVNVYDEDGRLTEQLAYRMPEEEYVLISKERRTYDIAENGDEIVVVCLDTAWETLEPSPYTEITYHYNNLGIETYYKKGNYYQFPGKITYVEEHIYPTDEFGNILYTYWYGFNMNEENTRYGEAHEVYEYAPGNNPETGYLNKIGNNIYVGTGRNSDDSWQLSQYYGWTYADNDVNTGQMLYAIVNDERVPSAGFELVYDFDVPFESLVFWPIGNKRDSFYQYQTLRETTLVNYDYYLGVVNFDQEESFNDNFYYSDIKTVGVADVADGDRIEVERYNISGHVISKETKGLNIIKYSDGSVEKVMVK